MASGSGAGGGCGLDPCGLDASDVPSVAEERKLRGGYYTPPTVAHFLADWAIRDGSTRVLEPSAGDGEVVVAAEARLQDGGEIVAVELVPDEAAHVSARSNGNATVVSGDFFEWATERWDGRGFDAVVVNPPFIRYQDFQEEHRERAFSLMRAQGLHPSRLTNAWLPFVAVATSMLNPGGRIALVLPAELLQVNYAAELRQFLARQFAHVVLVTFRRLVFDGTQQEVVLLLGSIGGGEDATIRIVQLDDIDDLARVDLEAEGGAVLDLDHASEKWTQFYLSRSELGLVRGIEDSQDFTPLGRLASVDVGVVTGRNEFFVLDRDQARARKLRRWCVPLVGRSSQVPGLRFDEDHWAALLAEGERVLLLQLGDKGRRTLATAARSYVEEGETQGFDQGYKCRIRLPNWWKVPSDWVPGAFMLRQIHDAPRIIANSSRATCTDTIHRLRIADGVKVDSLAAASVSSLTAAFAEIRGRSYGGGVLELEPREAEALPFPAKFPKVHFKEIDAAVHRRELERAMDLADQSVLPSLGMTSNDRLLLRGIWHRLANRRHDRGRRR